ncbi:WbqC-like protein [Neolewinella xylanilytica]|uniref:WbqC-like protein n=1 Tax=Neolewinella xylanilytica TaxID=1514080 RepID=A0A2S6I6F9_9BACT|nr:WbqC-like protein [Neolewinella xylanilytica]
MTAGQWTWEAHENYQKGGWRNRCRIATANGPLLLSVPLEGGKHQQMPIRDVRISYRTDWQRQHEQSIRSAYGRAPYFEYYADAVLAAATAHTELLWDYNWLLSTTVIELLSLDVELDTTERFCAGSAGATPFPKPVPTPPYPQLFEDRHGFLSQLSILDALFCLGPELPLLLHQR